MFVNTNNAVALREDSTSHLLCSRWSGLSQLTADQKELSELGLGAHMVHNISLKVAMKGKVANAGEAIVPPIFPTSQQHPARAAASDRPV